jgi:hypothetical protein
MLFELAEMVVPKAKSAHVISRLPESVPKRSYVPS